MAAGQEKDPIHSNVTSGNSSEGNGNGSTNPGKKTSAVDNEKVSFVS